MAAKKKDTVETVETEAVIQEAAEDQKAEDVQTDPEGKQEDQEEEELSPIAKRYQVFYKKGFWTKKMLKNMVGKKITEREYEIITGEAYA
ncbi:XkdX family protein [Blautia obeum]|jgi:hypothetical protein|uniref:XkdX family protein n=1 Tax=Blautia obeum TaxID=40520 RepID=A0A412ELY9_9FIRM|nr:XkdX family protein [Blautia obeum]RGR45770.1 XkdX family protein [Blautia obeum]